MLNSKTILWTIIIFIVAYIGFEYKQTRDLVVATNESFYGNKSSKEAHMVAYGPAHPVKQVTHPISFELHGEIDEDMAYSIRTLYRATADKKSCKSFSSWDGGWSAASEDFEYFPKIKGKYHSVKVPLDIFDEKMIYDMFKTAVDQEIKWTNHIIGNDIAGITKESTEQYTKWLANDRLEMLKLKPLYPDIMKNPYKHLESMADNNSEKTNFFESTVVNYTQSSSMKGSWDF